MNNNSNSRELADKLINWIREYSLTNIDSYQIDEENSIPAQLLEDFGKQGFFGMHISKKYGGLALKISDMLRVIEQISAIDLTLATLIIENIQGAHTLEKYATPHIKQTYLEKLAHGKILTAGAMTESAAGSNPRAMQTTATPNETGGWLLNGSKRWAGMADKAQLIAIYANQYDANNAWSGMSGFLVPGKSAGLEISPPSQTMGIRGFSKNALQLENVLVPAENLLGKIGEGMEIAQDNMMFIRLCLAASTVGAMKRCVQLAHRYAERRIIATGKLIENPVTQARLSEKLAILGAIDNFVYLVSAFYDENPSFVPEEAFVVCKVTGSEYLGKMADFLVQTLGARGYEEASGVSKIFRDARVFRIFEGPTEALNMYIGSKLSENNIELENFIGVLLKQPELFKQIKNTLNQVTDFCFTRKTRLFSKPFSLNYWLHALMGEIVTYGLLLAGIEYRLEQNKTGLEQSKIWAQEKYHEAIKKALCFSLTEKLVLEQNAIREIVTSYSDKIGDIDPVRTFKEIEIDPLLTSHHIDAPSSKQHLSEKQEMSGLSSGVHHIFEAQVALTPRAIAAVFQNETITYDRLNAEANKVANYLTREGIHKQMVALYIDRSIEMIIGLLGILKAGCAYLPLDPCFPEKSLGYMVEDSGTTTVLTQKTMNITPFSSRKILHIEDALALEDAATTFENQADFDGGNLCYLIYTSGSTGKPKGVMLSHKALSNLLNWHRHKIPGKRNVLQFTTLNFDMSFLEIFSALGSGGSLVLISEKDRMDHLKLSKVLKEYQVQQLILPVAYFKSLAAAKLESQYYQGVREIILAGEQLIVTPAILSFFKQLNACKLFNYYGPAESHVVTVFAFPERMEDWPEYPPIGKAIDNIQILLLDEDLNPVPFGEAGEIYIGGICLADGYINKPKLTSKVFIEIPDKTNPEKKWYRSGDFAKYLPDGNLLFVGRKDEQVKVRGYRIELQEIELNLLKHPRIKEAVVIVRKDLFVDQRLEAFLVLADKTDENIKGDILRFLKERMPAFMLPSQITILDNFPLSSTGKIDRHALMTDSRYSSSSPQDTIISPESETEKIIIDTMEEVFKTPIGVNYSFASIGGNSLLAMHIISKLKTRFHLEIPVYCLLSDPTIAATANRIDSLKQKKH